VGAVVDDLPRGPRHAILFGEDQARYLVACSEQDAVSILQQAASAGVPAMHIGKTGGAALQFVGDAPISLEAMRAAWENALPDYMAGEMPDGFATV